MIRFYLKSQRILCVSFSKTDSGLCIYHLFVWSNASHPPRQIPSCAYTTCSYGQMHLILLDRFQVVHIPLVRMVKCISSSETDSKLCIYHLFVWSNASHPPRQIPSCAYTTCSYGQMHLILLDRFQVVHIPLVRMVKCISSS